MTSKEAINKIKHLLFGAQTFGMLKTKDGVELKIEGDVELKKEVYVITADGELPAGDKDYEMEDGMLIKIKEGLIDRIDYPKTETETEVVEEELETDTEVDEETMGEHEDEEVKMVTAELIDGTIVETDTEELKVGDALFVLTAEGRVEAPDSVHETTDGKMVTTEAGIVVKIEEKVEETVTEEELNFDELLEVFTAGFTHLNSELKVLKDDYKNLTENFKRFSAEPVTDRLYNNPKGEYVKQLNESKFSKLEALAALKNKK